MVETPLQPARRALEHGIGIAFADGEGADQVGCEFVVDDGGAGVERLFRIEHRRQRLEIELDQLRRVLGGIAALRHDDRNRLADVADLVVGQQRLLRIDELVLHQRRPFARQRQLRIRHRRQLARRAPARSAHRTTPGAAAARDTSIALMRACACGLRTNTACSMCGNSRSAMYWPRPVRSRRSSRRVMERPMKGVWSFILKASVERGSRTINPPRRARPRHSGISPASSRRRDRCCAGRRSPAAPSRF